MIVRPPRILTMFFKSLVWRISDKSQAIFLTFDDGPIPETTPIILRILKAYDVKATFFCIGDNVQKYPELYQQIIDEGHAVGNHSFNHVVGWHTDTYEYLENIAKASELIDSKLFRPPHGKITPRQIKLLRNNYKIIMWDVLSYDYDKNVDEKQCLRNVMRYTRPGSIIVLHDSLKAREKVLFVLPRILNSLKTNGFRFSVLKQ